MSFRSRSLGVAFACLAAVVAGVAALVTVVNRPPQTGRSLTSLAASVAAVERGSATTPLISAPGPDGRVTVTFLAKRSAGAVPRVVSDITGWGEHIDGTFDFTVGTMKRVGESDWFSLETAVERGARIEYQLSYGQTDYRNDPHNPRRSDGPNAGGMAASEFVTPGYQPPPEFSGTPSTSNGVVRAAAVRGVCRADVYLPFGHRLDGRYPVAMFLDPRSRQVARTLDWMIERGEIPPVVAAFVAQPERVDTHCSGADMLSFVRGRLLPWLLTHAAATQQPAERAVLAVSFQAKDALAVVNGDDAPFGRLGLLLPGRRITRDDIDAVAKWRGRPLRVAILGGRYDHANLPTARGLREALRAAGHAVDHIEVPEGHSAVTWRNHLREVLVALFGRNRPSNSI
jgi:enterochelin esterase-like enzyme